MALGLRVFLLCSILVGCSSNPANGDSGYESLEKLQTELSISLKAPVIDQIQYKVVTDLQFDLGCRGKGVPIESCDFQETLSVVFDRFDCKSNSQPTKQFSTLRAIRDGGTRCSYTGRIHWPDGSTDVISRKDELYRLQYYSDGLSHEYWWTKIDEAGPLQN